MNIQPTIMVLALNLEEIFQISLRKLSSGDQEGVIRNKSPFIIASLKENKPVSRVRSVCDVYAQEIETYIEKLQRYLESDSGISLHDASICLGRLVCFNEYFKLKNLQSISA